MVPEVLKINRPRTVDLNHTIWKWPTSQIMPMRVMSHFLRIATPPSDVSFHPFGFPNKPKGLGANVGASFGHIVNGPRSTKWAAKSWSLVRALELQRKTSKIQRSRNDCWDRGAVVNITREACYKRRSTRKEEDTLKTLERATPTLRPCFHQSLDLFS